MKKHLIKIFFLSFLMLFSLLVGFENNVLAISDLPYTLDNWESYNVGVNSGTGSYAEWTSGEDLRGIVSNTWAYSGTKSLYSGNNAASYDICFWNMTSYFDYIGEIVLQLRIYMAASAGANSHIIYFVFYNTSGIAVLQFRIYCADTVDNWFQQLDSESNWNTIATFTETTWQSIYFRFLHTGDNMGFFQIVNSVTDANYGCINDTVPTTDDWTTFSRLHIVCADIGTSAGQFYLDDIQIDVEGEGESQSGYGDISGYKKTCSGAYDGVMWAGTYDFVEFRIIQYFTGTIRAFDFYIPPLQYYACDEVTNYVLYVEGLSQGTADYIFNDGDKYIVRWTDLQVTIDDRVPLFTVYSSCYGLPLVGWGFCTVDYYDYYDYGRNLKLHSDPNLARYIGFDGQLFKNCPMYCWYFSEPTPIIPDQEGFITTDKSIYEEYDTVFISGDIESPSGNYIKIERNEVEVVDNLQGFVSGGYHLTDYEPSFHVPFTLDSTDYQGIWNVSLWNSVVGYIDNSTFTVTNIISDKYDALIWTKPKISEPYDSFTVGWKYVKANYTYDGAVAKSHFSVWDNDNFISVIRTGITGDGSTKDTLYGTGTYYYYLLREIATGIYEPIEQTQHYVGVVGMGSIIRCDDDEYFPDLNYDVPTWVVKFSGRFSTMGTSTYVKYSLGGVFQFRHTLGESGKISYTKNFLESGYWNASLVYKAVDGEHILSYCTFWCKSGLEGDAPSGILPPIDPLIGGIAGVCLTLGFLFAPLFVLHGMKDIKFKVDVPPTIYVFTGGLGVVFAMFCGCWGWEVPFFLIGMAVIVTALGYIMKTKIGGE